MRLNEVATLLLRVAPLASFSNTGGAPLELVQPCIGPGAAFRYQPSQSTVGIVIEGNVWSSDDAKT